ncbi:hypothetical protein HJC23_012512 [Cyclotella cryptica]|uniref:Peptidylprolyl isomerase n=1 Tax=Cyclotella cryptica TaxID=29204 RepID=A0ABD3QQ77_9STRA
MAAMSSNCIDGRMVKMMTVKLPRFPTSNGTHDRDSPHILPGRAEPGGMLKVIAGADVKAGKAIDISYSGGVEGNNRLIQDYGFLHSGGSMERASGRAVAEGYRVVAN